VPATEARRRPRLHSFDQYLQAEGGFSLDELLDGFPGNVVLLNTILEEYCRLLWAWGRPYSHLADLLTGITGLRRELKGRIPRAWDVGFVWRELEPGGNLAIIPKPLLRALVALALFRGWPRFASLLGAAFAGWLRPGEYLGATRFNIQFPQDVCDAERTWTLWRHFQPKTRRSGARQQPSRIDDKSVQLLLWEVFGGLQPPDRLWPWAPSRFRDRYRQLATAFGTTSIPLGGARGGGATDYYAATEDAPRTLRRGRWSTYQVMDRYLQEAETTNRLDLLSDNEKLKVQALAAACPWIVSTAIGFLRRDIPPAAWPSLFIKALQVT